jgi:type VI protein secretion system component Hcp
MDNAQVYMSLVRPTGIPVAGECAADLPFTGQVELHGWSWTLINLEEHRRAKRLAKPYERKKTKLATKSKMEARNKVLQQMIKSDDLSEARLSAIGKLVEEIGTEVEAAATEAKKSKEQRAAERATEDEEEDMEQRVEDAEKGNYEFSFSKRVDIASTQMLNSMKSGDIFPTGILTIHQSSANAGLSLVITVQKVRLIDYALKVEVSDTMTDMREEWTAEFASLAYVYKNRKSINSTKDAGQLVPKAVSQGTVRAFAMKNLGSPI